MEAQAVLDLNQDDNIEHQPLRRTIVIKGKDIENLSKETEVDKKPMKNKRTSFENMSLQRLD